MGDMRALALPRVSRDAIDQSPPAGGRSRLGRRRARDRDHHARRPRSGTSGVLALPVATLIDLVDPARAARRDEPGARRLPRA